MQTKPKTMLRASRKTLEAINEGLEEIAAYFGWENPLTNETAEEPQAATSEQEEDAEVETAEAEEVDDDEEYDDSYEETDDKDGWVDKEEIEVAVDAFLSSLLWDGVIRKSKSGKLPSFASVFEKFFDEEDEMVKLARAFEDNVEGYFDWVSPDDMTAAQTCFLEIRRLLQELIKG